MIKITDVLGAFVEAQLRAAEWEQEFQAQFFGPLKIAEQVQAFLATPAEERAGMAPDESPGWPAKASGPGDEQVRRGEHAQRMQQTMGQGPRAKGQGD
jgi:hypothetical protein